MIYQDSTRICKLIFRMFCICEFLFVIASTLIKYVLLLFELLFIERKNVFNIVLSTHLVKHLILSILCIKNYI